jgi:prepilin-type N-terminal cleavage/methylation domain-containing protein
MAKVGAAMIFVSSRHSRDGYTLVELLFVVAVCGLVASISWPSASHFSNQLQVKAAAGQAIAALMRGRESAVLHNRTEYVTLSRSLITGSFGTPSFFADGSASGFRAIFKKRSTSTIEVVVHPSGEILFREQ